MLVLFLLAMDEHRLGNAANALRWHEQALAACRQGAVLDDETKLARSESARMLGVRE